MKISIGCLKEHQKYQMDESISFDQNLYKNEFIRQLKNISVHADYQIDGEYLNVTIKVKGDAVLACSYTLEDVDYKINCSDEITYTDNKDNESEDIIYFDKNEIDLDPQVLGLIIASLPRKITKKGAKLPEGGKGYRVLSEEEFLKEREGKKSSPFDALSDLDIDN